MYRLEVEHNAETAHRFFAADSSPKCRSIHGHSWRIILTLKTEKLDSQGMVVEFGQLKMAWRGWLDAHLDHALMLNHADPLAALLQAADPGMRIFLTPADPTTEHLACMLAQQAEAILENLGYSPSVQIERVRVEETRVNSAEYLPSLRR
jgi:6-pyruvoyltetrahydropterin/6-carboxytetrahydropterin synthase